MQHPGCKTKQTKTNQNTNRNTNKSSDCSICLLSFVTATRPPPTKPQPPRYTCIIRYKYILHTPVYKVSVRWRLKIILCLYLVRYQAFSKQELSLLLIKPPIHPPPPPPTPTCPMMMAVPAFSMPVRVTVAVSVRVIVAVSVAACLLRLSAVTAPGRRRRRRHHLGGLFSSSRGRRRGRKRHVAGGTASARAVARRAFGRDGGDSCW